MRFVHETLPQRVRFASGEAAAQLAEEVDRLGVSRLMVIATETQQPVAHRIADGLPVAVWHHGVAMHVPAAVAEDARRIARVHDVDALVSVGGGSTTGLAKAVALTTGLPVIAVPTTYSGSEATDVWGLTGDGRKRTGTDRSVLPRAVVYDATLTVSLPVEMSIASGLNALAHCVDSMWAPRADPINGALAVEGIRAVATGLPVLTGDPADLDAREQLLYGAYLSAVAFASAGSGLHHKICHVLGGMFDLPHAQTHAVVLPHVLALNAAAAPAAEQRLADAFGSATATDGLRTLRESVDAPAALRDYGMPDSGIPAAVRAVLEAAPADNPAPLTPEIVTALLRAAWEGRQP
ncbi:maleylacetate reductase [Nocardioides pakistanensis]